MHFSTIVESDFKVESPRSHPLANESKFRSVGEVDEIPMKGE